MKYIAFCLSVVIILFAIACNKEGIESNTKVNGGDNATLQGKWDLVQTLSDPGDGSGSWQAATTSASLMFNADGTMSGTTFPAYITYTIKDSVTLTFSQADKTIQNYRYKISHDSLTISPDGPIRCIEACGIRFKKVK